MLKITYSVLLTISEARHKLILYGSILTTTGLFYTEIELMLQIIAYFRKLKKKIVFNAD